MTDTTQVKASTFAELRTAVQFSAQQYKAFANADALLATLEGMEQNQRELAESVASKRVESASLDTNIAAKKQELIDTHAQINKAIEDGNTTTNDQRARADAYATRVCGNADAAVQISIKAGNETLERVQADIATAQAALLAKADELDVLETKIAAARKQMSEMLRT